MSTVYEIITDQIVSQSLNKGNVPWLKPWDSAQGAPKNFISGKAYRGINTILLGAMNYSSPYWMTFKQALSKGGCVRKGEKGTPIIFWKFTEEENDEGSKVKKAMVQVLQGLQCQPDRWH